MVKRNPKGQFVKGHTIRPFTKARVWKGKKRPEHSRWMKEHHPHGMYVHTKKHRQDMSKRSKKMWASGVITAEHYRDMWKKNPHPKGMLGKHHSLETRKRLSQYRIGRHLNVPPATRKKLDKLASQRMIRRLHTSGGNIYSSAKRGYRTIGRKKIFFRSKWEANYARYLAFLLKKGNILSWQYEPKTFWFEKIRRGVRSYTPDFLVRNASGDYHWHEVKGWLDAKSKTKLKRMAKYYPNESVILIQASDYKEISKKVGSLIDGWE